MGTVVPAVLCPVLVSCQALSKVLIIFLISNGELLCCLLTQILTRQGAAMLIRFNFSTLTYRVLCNPVRNGGVFWQRKPTWAPSGVLDELAVGASYGRSHLQKVCRQTRGAVETALLARQQLPPHRGDTVSP